LVSETQTGPAWPLPFFYEAIPEASDQIRESGGTSQFDFDEFPDATHCTFEVLGSLQAFSDAGLSMAPELALPTTW
jgi:hypothetical protein